MIKVAQLLCVDLSGRASLSIIERAVSQKRAARRCENPGSDSGAPIATAIISRPSVLRAFEQAKDRKAIRDVVGLHGDFQDARGSCAICS